MIIIRYKNRLQKIIKYWINIYTFQAFTGNENIAIIYINDN